MTSGSSLLAARRSAFPGGGTITKNKRNLFKRGYTGKGPLKTSPRYRSFRVFVEQIVDSTRVLGLPFMLEN
jgi:hypothetical protein